MNVYLQILYMALAVLIPNPALADNRISEKYPDKTILVTKGDAHDISFVYASNPDPSLKTVLAGYFQDLAIKNPRILPVNERALIKDLEAPGAALLLKSADTAHPLIDPLFGDPTTRFYALEESADIEEVSVTLTNGQKLGRGRELSMNGEPKIVLLANGALKSAYKTIYVPPNFGKTGLARTLAVAGLRSSKFSNNLSNESHNLKRADVAILSPSKIFERNGASLLHLLFSDLQVYALNVSRNLKDVTPALRHLKSATLEESPVQTTVPDAHPRTQIELELTRTAISTIQYELQRIGHSTTKPNGVWDETTRAATNRWLGKELTSESITIDDLRKRLDIVHIAPWSEGQENAPPNQKSVPFAVLNNSILGGVNERNYFTDARLAGISFEQCMAECAADRNCGAIGFDHGCTLLPSIGYRLNSKGSAMGWKSAVLLTRVDQSTDVLEKDHYSSLESFLLGYSPKPNISAPKVVQLDDLIDQKMEIFDVGVFQSGRKTEAISTILEEYPSDTETTRISGFPPGFHTFPWIFISKEHKAAAKATEAMLADETLVLPVAQMFEEALAKAEEDYGKEHPALGLILQDMAWVLDWSRLQVDASWEKKEKKRQLRLQRSARLLADFQLVGAANSAELQAQAQIGSIKFYDYDEEAPVPDEGTDGYARYVREQGGRCYALAEHNQARSSAILRATRDSINASGLHHFHLGWIRRARDCIEEPKKRRDIAALQLAVAIDLNDSYATSFAWTDLARTLFNIGDRAGARKAFDVSFSLFTANEKPGYMKFIHDQNYEIPDSSTEYYADNDHRIHDVQKILVELGMDAALHRAFALELQAMLSSTEGNVRSKSYIHRAFIQDALVSNNLEFVLTMLSGLDTLRTGRTAVRPVETFLSIYDDTDYLEGYNSEFLSSAQILIGSAKKPGTDVALISRIAQSSEAQGNIRLAAQLSELALDIITTNEITTGAKELTELKRLVAAGRREQGDVSTLAKVLAMEVEQRLKNVCDRKLDLVAFPQLPLDLLHDDPLLTDVFMEQPVVGRYLECFNKHSDSMANTPDRAGTLPVLRLMDIGFIMGKLNLRDKANSMLKDIVLNLQHDTKGSDTFEMAFSRFADGLILSGHKDWLSGMEVTISSLRIEMDGVYSEAMMRMAFTFHALGWEELFERTQRIALLEEHWEAIRLAQTNEPFDCPTNGPACELVVFLANDLSGARPSSKEALKLRSSGLAIRNNVVNSPRTEIDGKIYMALHQLAGRSTMALMYAEAVFQNYNLNEITVERLLEENPFGNANSTIKYLTILIDEEQSEDKRERARAFTGSLLEYTRKNSNSFSLFGSDPIVRNAARLRSLFESHLRSVDLPVVSRVNSITKETEDLVFLGQFLQATNTASTFAKLSSRLSTDSRRELRDLQEVTAEISEIFDEIVILDLSAKERLELGQRLAVLQNRQTILKDSLTSGDPNSLTASTLQIPKATEISAVLRPNEALISYYVGRDQSYVWLYKNDSIEIHALDRTRAELSDIAFQVRQTTSSEKMDMATNLSVLSEAYSILLKPFEASLAKIDTLIFVPNGPLDGVPFNALLTERSPATSLMPSELQAAQLPWLIRRYSLAQLPSLASAVFLRSGEESTSNAPHPFIGVGNPEFEEGLTPGNQTLRSSTVQVEPLPETATELYALAGVLKANQVRDLLLGRDADEAHLQTLELRDYRIIAFATHGVIAGEIPGITEPALLLSKPTEADRSRGFDGVLTASEISKLELNANLVILTACNSASSNGRPGTEGLSGMVSAFIFAGARQVIATHWRIPSETALLMSIGTTVTRSSNPQLGWHGGMRMAALDLIENPTRALYAHPINWAAYIFVGMPE